LWCSISASRAGLSLSHLASGVAIVTGAGRERELVPGSMALALDQIPESLLPAIAARWVLPVSVLDIIFVTGLFFVGELVASRVLFALNIRDRPY
jgi:hypothetical protein